MNDATAPIRVAVVDDSRSIRSWLRHLLQADPRLSVVGEAGSGAEARALLRHEAVDVMTLDVDMPGMSGIEFLRRLMIHRPMPVVMLSAYTERGSEAAVQALSLGAVDCIEKPRLALTPTIGEDICQRVFEAAQVQVQAQGRFALPNNAVSRHFPTPQRAWSGDIILLGASTGGVAALESLLGEIDGLDAPVVIAQHMPEAFLHSFGRRLSEYYARRFQLARDGLVLEPGQGVLALGKERSTCLERQRDGSIRCVFRAPSAQAVYRPNIDDLFHSGACTDLSGAAALLTGMGRDGAAGLLALRQAGFVTYAQNASSSVVYGMPRAAVENGAAQFQGDPAAIGRQIAALGLAKTTREQEKSV